MKCNRCDIEFNCDRRINPKSYYKCESKNDCICPYCFISTSMNYRDLTIKVQYQEIRRFISYGCWTSFNLKNKKTFKDNLLLHKVACDL